MDVDQQDVLVETAASSTPARSSVSKTSDTEVGDLQQEIDGLKMISAAQPLRIQELEKVSGTCRNDCGLRKNVREKIVL